MTIPDMDEEYFYIKVSFDEIKSFEKIKFRKKIYVYLAFGGMVARKIGNIY